MNTYRRWALPFALAGAAAAGTAFTLFQRKGHRLVAKQQHKESVQCWEGEGGSHVVPATAQPLPPLSSDPAAGTRGTS
jgi:hypothetical protein